MLDEGAWRAAFRPGGGEIRNQKNKTKQKGSVKVPLNVDRFGENFIYNFLEAAAMRRQLGGRLQKSLGLGTGADCPLCRRQLLSPADKEQQFSPRLRDRYASEQTLAIEADCCFIQAADDDTRSDGLRCSRSRASFAGIVKDILDRGWPPSLPFNCRLEEKLKVAVWGEAAGLLVSDPVWTCRLSTGED